MRELGGRGGGGEFCIHMHGSIQELLLPIFKYAISTSHVVLPSAYVEGACALVLHAAMSVPLPQVPPSLVGIIVCVARVR